MLYTAVSKTIHRHPASKLASADEIAFDSPLGYPLQKRETEKTVASTMMLTLTLTMGLSRFSH